MSEIIRSPEFNRYNSPKKQYAKKASTLNICRALQGTVTQYNRGQKMLGDQFPDTDEGRIQLNDRIARARMQGYNPSPWDTYDPTLAQSMGGKEGFIPQDDPVGHVKSVCQEFGLSTDTDLVKVTAPQSDPTPSIPLAEDLIQEEISKRITVDPGLADKNQTELRESVIDKHGYTDFTE